MSKPRSDGTLFPVDASGTSIRDRKDKSGLARPTDVHLDVWKQTSLTDKKNMVEGQAARDYTLGEATSSGLVRGDELPLDPPPAPPPALSAPAGRVFGERADYHEPHCLYDIARPRCEEQLLGGEALSVVEDFEIGRAHV